MSTDRCLSADELKAFVDGSLPESLIEQVGLHLDRCLQCESIVESLERQQDDLIRELRCVSELPNENSAPLLSVKAKLLLFPENPPSESQSKMAFEERPLGPFDLLDLLGQGGMGRVYLARHRKMHRLVVVKVIRPEFLAAGETHISHRFEQEILAAGRVKHPNLVTAYDAGEVEGEMYLSMEYLEGEDLGRIVRSRGPLPVSEAVDYICQAAEGIQAAHADGIIHRDIKPSNLMVTPQGVVKVLDLGLARLQSSETRDFTRAGQIIGTMQYMASEQFDDSHQVDPRADVYGLAATLYKLLTGLPPVGADLQNTLKLVKAALSEIPRRVDEIRPDVPSTLADLIARSLSKTPSDRPGSAAEFASALKRTVQGTSSSSNTTLPFASKPEALGHQKRGRLLPLVLLLIPVGGLILWRSFPQGDFPSAKPLLQTDSASTSSAQVPYSEAFQRDVYTPLSASCSLDRLDHSLISESFKRPWHPAELVAIFGNESQRHWGTIFDLKFNRDGTRLASSGTDSVRIWETSSMREVFSLPQDQFQRNSSGEVIPPFLDFLSDGNLLTLQPEGQVHVWEMAGDLPTLKFTTRLVPQIAASALSSDGRLLAVASKTPVKLHFYRLEFPLQERLSEFFVTPEGLASISILRIVDDGKKLFAADHAGKFELWDLSTAVPEKIHGFSLNQESNNCTLDISADGNRIFFRRNVEGDIQIWDIGRQQELAEKRLEFPFGGSLIASPVSDEICCYDGTNLKQIQSPLENPQIQSIAEGCSPALHPQVLAISPDGQLFASSVVEGDRIRLWRKAEQRFQREVGGGESENSTVLGVGFSSDCRRIGLVAEGGGQPFKDLYLNFQAWIPSERGGVDFSTQQPTRLLLHHPWVSLLPAVRFDRENVGEATEEFIKRFQAAEDLELSDHCCSSLSNPTPDLLATGYNDGRIVIWSTDPAASHKIERTSFQAHAGRVHRVLFSPAGTLISYGLEDQTLIVWDISPDIPRRIRESRFVNAATDLTQMDRTFHLAVSPDGSRIACSMNGVWDWDLSQPQPKKLSLDQNPQYSFVGNLAYLPDNRGLLVGGLNPVPYSLVLWDLKQNQLLKGWKFPGPTLGVACANDGKHVACVNANHSAFILRLTARNE